MPRLFGQVSKKHQTPYVALIAYTGIAVVLAVIFGYQVGPYTYFGDATTLGTIPLIITYATANVALPIYYLRHHRSEFNVWKHLIIPSIGVAVLIWPFWGLVQPNQAFSYNTYPWIVLGLIVVSVLWTLYLSKRDPSLANKAMDVFQD